MRELRPVSLILRKCCFSYGKSHMENSKEEAICNPTCKRKPLLIFASSTSLFSSYAHSIVIDLLLFISVLKCNLKKFK